MRESDVRSPSFFSCLRSSALNATSARDAKLDGACLAVDAAARDRREHVELLAGFRQQQRTFHLRPQRVGGEVALELTMVDGDGARAGAEEHAGGGCLAATRGVVFDARQV